MGKYINDLGLELNSQYPDVGYWLVSKPFLYYCCFKGCIISVPKMFPTDLASIPRIFYPIIDKSDSIIVKASVVHDFLYTSGQFSRKEADLVLKEAMLESKSSKFMANLVYLAVRLFGKSKYKS